MCDESLSTNPVFNKPTNNAQEKVIIPKEFKNEYLLIGKLTL